MRDLAHSSAEGGASIPTELEAARGAFLDLIANAYEFSEEFDGEYDYEGRLSGSVTYTLRFDGGCLENLIEALRIVQMIDESPKDAIDRANEAIDAADELPEPRCVNAHDRCFMGGPCPYCEAR